jgi:hypothetical protein
MKIRYRNRSTSEARDITVGSAEETTVKTAFFTVNGESLPLWVLESEWEAIQAQGIELSSVKPVFGRSSRRLTAGERAMGIHSYEQKVRENNPLHDELIIEKANDEEENNPTTTPTGVNPGAGDPQDDDPEPEADEDEEEDDDVEAEAPIVTAPKRARRAPRRTTVSR